MAEKKMSDFVIENKVLVKYTGNDEIVTVPEGVTEIKGCYNSYGDWKGAFESCTNLKIVVISKGVKSIGDWAFKDCADLKSISIPSSVTGIGNRAFCCCENLASVVVPDSVTSIGKWAFWGCNHDRDLTIRCSRGSYAEQYAKENNIPYTIIESANETIDNGVVSACSDDIFNDNRSNGAIFTLDIKQYSNLALDCHSINRANNGELYLSCKKRSNESVAVFMKNCNCICNNLYDFIGNSITVSGDSFINATNENIEVIYAKNVSVKVSF